MNKEKNILITGADGQLGMEFRAIESVHPQVKFFFAAKADLSVTDENAIDQFISENKITDCINCAAYTAVDKAETEKEIAFEINGKAPGILAGICEKYQVQLIHISTDYVFDGDNLIPYKESDPTNPTGVYGASKREGEIAVLRTNPSALIIRTSWVFSRYGNNFVKTMMRLMCEKETLSVVDDQVGCPTYAADLADAIMKIINSGKINNGGVYHFCNEGKTTWYEFALEIKDILKSNCKINPIRTSEYPTAAKRPQYSVLDTSRIKKDFEIVIPSWKESLKKCMGLLHL